MITQDSVGGGLPVAQRVAQDPSAGPRQAQAVVDAVHQAFAPGVAQTGLVGGIIMAAGTLVVLAVLPGRLTFGRKAGRGTAQASGQQTEGASEQAAGEERAA